MNHHPWFQGHQQPQNNWNQPMPMPMPTYRAPSPYAPPEMYRRITMEEAMAVAVERVPGEIVKVELEHEKGVLVYEVDIVTAQGVKYEVIVDVNNGNVLSIEID